MITLRQIVSEIIDDLHGINLDDRISYRFIASKFNSKIDYYLRLEAKSREFAKLQNLWRPIDEVKLQDVNVTNSDYIPCTILKRSVNKLPEAYSSNYGLLIKILTINGTEEFKLLGNVSEVKSYISSKRWGTKDLKVAYIENSYLFVPNLDLESVKVILIPVNPFEVDKANGLLTDCSSPLDAQITYPSYLITLAKKEVLQELAGIYKHIVEDEKGDDDTNQKN